MKSVKEILAENLIKLRKKNNLTQNEFAEKLNYSDNTVSRWERGEISPSIETLEQISQVFDIKIELLLKENAFDEIKQEKKTQFRKRLATLLLIISQIWFIAVVSYFYIETFLSINFWMIFVWAVPLSLILAIFIARKWAGRTASFVLLSTFIWTFLTAIYLQLLSYNLYLIFIIGAPAQLSLVVWNYVRKKEVVSE